MQQGVHDILSPECQKGTENIPASELVGELSSDKFKDDWMERFNKRFSHEGNIIRYDVDTSDKGIWRAPVEESPFDNEDRVRLEGEIVRGEEFAVDGIGREMINYMDKTFSQRPKSLTINEKIYFGKIIRSAFGGEYGERFREESVLILSRYIEHIELNKW